MKTQMIAATLAVLLVGGLWADTKDTGIIEETGFTWSKTGDVVPGEWTSQYTKAKEMATQEGIPMIAFFARRSCGNCKGLESLLVQAATVDWFKKRKFILLCGIEGEAEASSVVRLSQKGSTLPFVGLYWDRNGDGQSDGQDGGVNNKDARRGGSWSKKTAQDFMDWVESYFKDYRSYDGGVFAAPDEEGNRLECEDGTEKVSVVQVREGASLPATNNLLVVTYPNGNVKTNVINWAEGQTASTNDVDVTAATAGFTNDGEKVELVILDAEGEVQETNHITYVNQPVSSRNPLWLTERCDPRANGGITLQFGEWTMDLTAAQHLAEDEGGYVMAMVSGSLWCPNCTNFEYNLLTLDRDESGKSRFERWAIEHKVALVEIDMGRFMSGADEDTPTLLSKVPGKSGFYPSGMASGLGYLTRKNISDEKAAEVYARNCELSKKYAVDGGFFGPEDLEDSSCTKYRPRVPCFCLFRADGTCASRLTRFSFPTTPKAADQKWLDNYMKRFDEMLAIAGEGATEHADATELGNDYPGAHSTPLAANGGQIANEICCADLRDTFKLTGFSGNGILTARVIGESTAKVQVSFWKVTGGQAEMVDGAYASGKLNEGVTKELAAGTGDYYVQVRASNYTTPSKTITQLDAEFNPTNATPMNFIKYALSTTVILTPQDSRAEGVPPADSNLVTVRLVEGEVYRLEGLDPDADKTKSAFVPLTDGTDHLYVAKDGGDAEVACLKKGSEGGKLVYQTWEPGVVGFEPQAVTVPARSTTEKGTTITRKENEDVTIAYRRTTGISGDVKLKVSLDLNNTDFFYDYAPDAGYTTKTLPRFKINGEAVSEWSETVEWKDGTDLADCVSNILVTASEYEDYDVSRWFGPGKVSFKLEILEQTEAGDRTNVIDNASFVINFTETSKENQGKVAVVGVDREWAKKLTVYAREDELVSIDVGRVGAFNGAVFADVTKSVASVVLGGDYSPLLGFRWPNRGNSVQTLTVTNLPSAGKSVRLTLKAVTRGFSVLSASNSVTIVSVATNAPAFARTTASATLYRYTAVSNVYEVTGTVEGGTLSFTKLSGTLPSGLKAVWDKAANALAITGIPTGNDKAGKTYTVVYQVTERRPKEPGSRSTVSVPGLTIELTYTVVDPAYAGTGKEGKALNDSCAKSRTFKDQMVFAEDPEVDGAARLLGTLQVTLPATGKASAKFLCESGTVSFAAKSWDRYDISNPESPDYGCADCTLVGTTKGYTGWTLAVRAKADKSVGLKLYAPSAAFNDIEIGTNVWSATHSAADYIGYYTVTLALATDDGGEPVITGAGKDYASVGSGYITLKKMSSSQAKSGTVTWAGMLPNGTSISGSGILTEVTDELAWLPMVKFSSKDKFAGVVEIKRGAAAAKEGEDCWETVKTPEFEAGKPVYTWWRHTENSRYTGKGDFVARYAPYGGIYDSQYKLNCCCDREGRSTTMPLTVIVPESFSSDAYGQFGAVEPIDVTVGEHSITRVDSTGGANKITLSYAKSTGIVSGRFDLHYTDAKTHADKKLTATYTGVIQLGYGDECGCSVSLPFVNGCWYITDKIGYDWDEAKSAFKKWLSSIKRGGVFTIAPVPAK